MLISSMLPTLTGTFPGGVPNVEEIQRTMEILWSCGFDGRNAEHHCGCLVGKKTWIGTVEVWYVYCCVHCFFRDCLFGGIGIILFIAALSHTLSPYPPSGLT